MHPCVTTSLQMVPAHCPRRGPQTSLGSLHQTQAGSHAPPLLPRPCYHWPDESSILLTGLPASALVAPKLVFTHKPVRPSKPVWMSSLAQNTDASSEHLVPKCPKAPRALWQELLISAPSRAPAARAPCCSPTCQASPRAFARAALCWQAPLQDVLTEGSLQIACKAPPAFSRSFLRTRSSALPTLGSLVVYTAWCYLLLLCALPLPRYSRSSVQAGRSVRGPCCGPRAQSRARRGP